MKTKKPHQNDSNPEFQFLVVQYSVLSHLHLHTYSLLPLPSSHPNRSCIPHIIPPPTCLASILIISIGIQTGYWFAGCARVCMCMCSVVVGR